MVCGLGLIKGVLCALNLTISFIIIMAGFVIVETVAMGLVWKYANSSEVVAISLAVFLYLRVRDGGVGGDCRLAKRCSAAQHLLGAAPRRVRLKDLLLTKSSARLLTLTERPSPTRPLPYNTRTGARIDSR
ncbi:hypothetical protein MTO96_048184 [Rhipicephalus appendiculatus]